MTNSPHQATLHAGDALLAALDRIAAALEAQNAIAEAQIQRHEERRAASLAAAEADRARAADCEAAARDALERVTRAAEAITGHRAYCDEHPRTVECQQHMPEPTVAAADERRCGNCAYYTDERPCACCDAYSHWVRA